MKKPLGPKAFVETYGALKRCLASVAGDMYGDVGMGTTQVRLLRHVARHGPISQADLARATDADAALCGRALQSLLERGVLRRERSESDRREYLLELGPEGGDVLDRVERITTCLARRLVRPLDERDLEDFERIASKLLAAFAPGSEVVPTDETARATSAATKTTRAPRKKISAKRRRR